MLRKPTFLKLIAWINRFQTSNNLFQRRWNLLKINPNANLPALTSKYWKPFANLVFICLKPDWISKIEKVDPLVGFKLDIFNAL